MKPQLYVFAGPNGAGKSSFSASMVIEGTPIFDGDKEFARLKKNFYATDSGTLYDAVNGHIFEDWKKLQLSVRRDCAFETNFRSRGVMDSVSLFSKDGYETRLFFFGLDTIEAAIERVKLRVAGGGHDVSLENIHANYVEGLKNLHRYFKDFDSVHLLQNFEKPGAKLKITPLMKLEKGLLIERAAQLPDWAAAFEKEVIKQYE